MHDKQPATRIGIYDAYLATLGGGENFLAVLCEFLEQEFEKASIEILTHGDGSVGISDLAERFGVELRRTKVRLVPTTARNHLRFLSPLRRFFHEQDLSTISREYDLFVNLTIFSLTPPQSRRSVYICMFPLDPMPSILRAQPRRRRLLAPYVGLRRWLYRRWLSRYDLVLSISNYTQKWVRNLWGLDSEILYPPIGTLASPSPALKKRQIVTVGRFFPGNHNKKHDVLIDAFRHLYRHGLGDWQLHLVGGKTPVAGTEAYVEDLRRRAAGLPVHFHFDVPRSKLDELLQTSSIFWHATGFEEDESFAPEKFEHFGMSTVEAMTHGCVPVVYASGGQMEIIEHGDSGYLWRSRRELYHQTLELARDRASREAMAQRAHERSQRFSRQAFHAAARAYFTLSPARRFRRTEFTESLTPGPLS